MAANYPGRGTAEVDGRLEQAWRADRRYVLNIAFRTLGDLGESEDVVQEAFIRLSDADLDAIGDPRAWLVVVTGRLCIDRLRTAQRNRESAGLDGAAADLGGPGDPADRATLDDGVQAALELVLERLSPAERTAFVLHDVFGYTFEDIGGIVGRAPAACRQLASRARRHVRSQAQGRFTPDPADQRRITDLFLAACGSGDLDQLLALLDPDADGQVDLGGPAGLRPPITGSRNIAAILLHFYGPGSTFDLLSAPSTHGLAFITLQDGRLVATVSMDLEDGLVHHIETVVDPVKLAPVAARIGTTVGER